MFLYFSAACMVTLPPPRRGVPSEVVFPPVSSLCGEPATQSVAGTGLTGCWLGSVRGRVLREQDSLARAAMPTVRLPCGRVSSTFGTLLSPRSLVSPRVRVSALWTLTL